MLIGEYTHSIDDKNRISLPAKFRKEIGRTVIATHGLDSCLFLYSGKEWQKISEKVSELGMAQADRRGLNRFILAGATEIEVDANGRILIPEYLKKFASLEKEVVFAGVGSRIEIWNDKRWAEYKKKLESNAGEMAEKLGAVGF